MCQNITTNMLTLKNFWKSVKNVINTAIIGVALLFDFDPNEIWNSFNKLKIIAFKFDFSQEELNQTYAPNELDFIIKRLERMKVKLMNEIYALENEDSLGLFMGNCNLCMRCTKTIGMPCKMPFKLRYSIESLGGDVDKTVEDTFGYKIIYAKDGKLPEYMIFVGGLLYDKKITTFGG